MQAPWRQRKQESSTRSAHGTQSEERGARSAVPESEERNRSIERIYYAVVHGKPPTEEGVEKSRIQETKDKRVRLVIGDKRAGKEALTLTLTLTCEAVAMGTPSAAVYLGRAEPRLLG